MGIENVTLSISMITVVVLTIISIVLFVIDAIACSSESTVILDVSGCVNVGIRVVWAVV